MPQSILMLTSAEVRVLFKVSLRTVQDWAASGKIQAIKLKGDWLFPITEINTFAKVRSVQMELFPYRKKRKRKAA